MPGKAAAAAMADQRSARVQVLGVAFTAVIVLGTLWLLGAFGWAAGLVGIETKWLKSPIGLGT